MSSTEILESVSNLKTSLKCKVCANLLKEPVLLVKCSHSVCKSCYDGDRVCPVCNTVGSDSIEDKQLQEMLAHVSLLEEFLKPSSPSSASSHTTSPASCASSIVMGTVEVRKGVSSESPIPRRGRPSSAKSPASATPGNIDKKNHKGETQLQRAVIKGDIKKVQELIAAGAAVNTQDNNGWTPLHEACHYGFTEIVNLLLENGSLVNVPSFNDHITPLHDALINNRIEIAKLLVQKGADMHAKTSDGATALSIIQNDDDRNMLLEECSPFIEANVTLSEQKPQPDTKIIFLHTNLSDEQKEKLQKCAKMLDADIVTDFKPQVTHIVTSCDNSGNCTRTMKILLGILSGKWLMNFQWVEVCLEYKRRVEEEVFEVQGTKNQANKQGPQKSRLNHQMKLPSLFEGFQFYLQGQFITPDRADITRLISVGGGKILSREPRVSVDSIIQPYHASDTKLNNIDTVILTPWKPTRDKWTGNVAAQPVAWLIACISEFKILDYDFCTEKD